MNKSAPNIPLVSVWMITYNHEQYIKQAIESILMQKTTFTIELVIGEDCSTDNTASIIREYENKHPGIIKVRYNIQNLGIIPNMIKTLEECNGKYIAMCEGDDYWTDSLKLQKQVDYLNFNPNISAVAHRCLLKNEINNTTGYFGGSLERVLQLKEQLDYRQFHTASLVFRQVVLDDLFNCQLPEMISGDKLINLLCGIYGPIKYLPEIMATYRKNEGGVSNSKIKDTKQFLNNNISAFSLLRKKIPLTYYLQLKYFETSKLNLIQNSSAKSEKLKYYFLSILLSLPFFRRNLRCNYNMTVNLIKSFLN